MKKLPSFIIEYEAQTCLYNCTVNLDELFEEYHDIVNDTIDNQLDKILTNEYPGILQYLELADIELYDSEHYVIGFDSYYTFFVSATMKFNDALTPNDINKLKLKYPSEMAKKEYGYKND